jgi:hypothetical protein
MLWKLTSYLRELYVLWERTTSLSSKDNNNSYGEGVKLLPFLTLIKFYKMKNKVQHKDMVFILNSQTAPLSFMLNSRNTKANPLFYWDEDKGINRPLRYAKNQKTPFEDEQDGNAILEPIIFEDGALVAPKTNPVLQEFLLHHPGFGTTYSLLDNEKDAAVEVENINMQADALIEAKSLELETLLSIARVQLGMNTDKFSVAEIRRDVMMFAKNYPSDFLEAVSDPELSVNDIVARAFNDGILRFRNGNKDVYMNLPGNKTKLMTLPIGSDHIDSVTSLLKSDDGLPTLKLIEDNLTE